MATYTDCRCPKNGHPWSQGQPYCPSCTAALARVVGAPHVASSPAMMRTLCTGDLPNILTTAPPRSPYWPYRSKLEYCYSQVLEIWKSAGEVQDWWYEPLKLRLGEKCFYSPDFGVIRPANPGQLLLIETKGGFIRDDAMVKLKTAARQYPFFIFSMVQYKQGQWIESIIPCR